MGRTTRGLEKEPNRQRFELIAATGDQPAAIDEPICLGATRIEVGEDSTVVLADPDGNEFSVRGRPRRASLTGPCRNSCIVQ